MMEYMFRLVWQLVHLITLLNSIDEVIDLVGGKLNRIIIGHETDNWDIYPSKKCEDGLYMAEIALAEGETSKL